jgi:hypothetical protein
MKRVINFSGDNYYPRWHKIYYCLSKLTSRRVRSVAHKSVGIIEKMSPELKKAKIILPSSPAS